MILSYNIAHVHPNLIPIGVVMVHFSTYARPCVHPMTCASQMEKHARAMSVIKSFLERQHYKKCTFIAQLRASKARARGPIHKRFGLRTVPTIVTAHTFCASRDTRVSYG